MSDGSPDADDDALRDAVDALRGGAAPDQRLDEAAARLEGTDHDLADALEAYGGADFSEGLLTKAERRRLKPLCDAARNRGVGVTLSGLAPITVFDSRETIIDAAVRVYETPRFDETATEQRMKDLLADAAAAGVEVDEGAVVRAVRERAEEPDEQVDHPEDTDVIGESEATAAMSDGGPDETDDDADDDLFIGAPVEGPDDLVEDSEAEAEADDDEFIVGEPAPAADDDTDTDTEDEDEDEAEAPDDPIVVGGAVDDGTVDAEGNSVLTEGADDAGTDDGGPTEADGTDETATGDAGDAETEGAGGETSDGAGAVAAGDGRVAEALAAELRAGEVDEDTVATLNDNLELSLRRSEGVQVDYLHSRVGELEAYTEALETFLDGVGTAEEFVDRVEALETEVATVENLEATVEDLESRVESVEALEATVEDLTEQVAAVDDRVDALAADLGDVTEDLSALEDALDDLEDGALTDEDLADLREDVEDLEEALDAVEDIEDDLEDLEDDIEDLESWRGNLADVLAGQ